MTKAQRLEALKETLDAELGGFMRLDAGLLLWQFINGFKIKRYREDAKGLARVWYTIIAIPLFFDGFIRDVRVNSTAGKYMFGDLAIGDKKYLGLSTLTGTLWRVVAAGPTAQNYKLAVQIGEVLNDYDPGHVNLEGVK